jgi:hypothetical protein
MTGPLSALIIARQYDFWADTPAKLSDSFVVKNAIAGSMFVHTDYTNVNVNDPKNVKWTEGNITYVDVPNDILPVYQTMANLGQRNLALQLTAQHRAQLEAAYNRPVAIPVYNAPSTATKAAAVATDATTTTKPVTPVKPASGIKAAVQDLKAKIRAAVDAHKTQSASAAATSAKAPSHAKASVAKNAK